jgi:hypothetical protein
LQDKQERLVVQLVQEQTKLHQQPHFFLAVLAVLVVRLVQAAQ